MSIGTCKNKNHKNKNVQKYSYYHRRPIPQVSNPKVEKKGRLRYFVLLAVAVGCLLLFTSSKGHADSNAAVIKSDTSNCLDVYLDSVKPSSVVDSWQCNNSTAQDWSVTRDTIVHDKTLCLSVPGDSQLPSKVVLDTCTNAPGQIWIRDGNGFINPNSTLCLTEPNNKSGDQLQTEPCGNMTAQNDQAWATYPKGSSAVWTQATPCTGSKGEQIACQAEKTWISWTSPGANHEALLNNYTDGAPYEEWCADFVSYVYKQAGYPFTGGETNGWDENIAGNIQNMGFTMHDPSNYTPKPGDVAFFSYSGGHVEIVVSGGKTPTFIYGNSDTIDPTTGNGQMETNTKLSDGSLGQLVYYLSPN